MFQPRLAIHLSDDQIDALGAITEAYGMGYDALIMCNSSATCETLQNWRDSRNNWREPGSMVDDPTGFLFPVLLFENMQAIKFQQRQAMIIVIDLGEWRLVIK